MWDRTGFGYVGFDTGLDSNASIGSLAVLTLF